MARLTDTVRAALGYWWNLITDAAQAGFTVTDTIQLANQVATDLGGKLSFQENTAISSLYGYARRIINAGNVLQSSAPGKLVDADMIATAPYARDEREQLAYPLYHVKFEYTYLDAAGNEQTTIKTSVFPDRLPSTVGELFAEVLDDAEGFAKKYGHTLLSINPIQILAV